MDPAKKRRLEAGGWRVGTVAEFLGLTPAESEYVEIMASMSLAVRRVRNRRRWSRARFAKRLRTSTARVRELEVGIVPFDELLNALLEFGATRRDIARIIDAA
jgi:hypothetical protein